jgi:membrane protein implicated in regulation of membrane protease activity
VDTRTPLAVCRTLEIFLGWTWIAAFIIGAELFTAALLGRRPWLDFGIVFTVGVAAAWLCSRSAARGDRIAAGARPGTPVAAPAS